MIPKTFSAPGDATFPALNGFAPSAEDSLRFAVWLMLMADDVNRRAYSNIADEPERGVHISMGRPEYDPQTLALRMPCQIVEVAVAQGGFTYSTSRAGEKTIVIGIAHIEAANTSTIKPDAEAPSLTAEMRLDRVRKILMRGTLYDEDATTRDGKTVDPYFTPLNMDGTYGHPLKFISLMPPDVTPARKITFPNRRVKTDADLLGLDPVRDFAVSFGLLAKYTVIVRDRDAMR